MLAGRTTMPSTLRKAIGTMKDQTSIGLAKVSKTTSGDSFNLDVAVLKATSHDEVPIEERHVTEVLLLSSSSRARATACVQALSRRIDRTGNWVVALKSLSLIFRALQDGGPYFPHEAHSTIRRGTCLLDLSGFSDDSIQSNTCDYTAFIRTFALYLEDRLEFSLTGKLQNHHPRTNSRVSDMNAPQILDRIRYWQRLLDRAIATRPTGPTKNNRLVQISLYLIVRESFDLYRDLSDGLTFLLNNFFQLEYLGCLKSFRACTKAAKQFEELESFYRLCKGIGVGRITEYPNVNKISKNILDTLEEFLKDHQASSMEVFSEAEIPPKLLLLAPPQDSEDRASELSKPDRDRESEISEQSYLPEGYVQTSSSSSSDGGNYLVSDIMLLEDQSQAITVNSNGWELMLAESSGDMSNQMHTSFVEGIDLFPVESLYDQTLIFGLPQNYVNPFLHDAE